MGTRAAKRTPQIASCTDHVNPHRPSVANTDHEPVIDIAIPVVDAIDRLQIDLDRVPFAVVVRSHLHLLWIVTIRWASDRFADPALRHELDESAGQALDKL